MFWDHAFVAMYFSSDTHADGLMVSSSVNSFVGGDVQTNCVVSVGGWR